VDHRLVRDGHLQGRSAFALALYLFLVTVSDAEGLSWYSEAVLCRHLSWSISRLRSAREELERAELIAYRTPLYQVLDLAPVMDAPARPRGSGQRLAEPPLSAGEILRRLLSPAGEKHNNQGGAR